MFKPSKIEQSLFDFLNKFEHNLTRPNLEKDLILFSMLYLIIKLRMLIRWETPYRPRLTVMIQLPN